MGNKIRAEEQKNRRTEVLQCIGMEAQMRRSIEAIIFLALLLYCSTALLLFCSSTLSAQEKKNAKEEPTVITSKTLTVDNRANTALFEGSVVARKGEMTLFADRMLVYYSEEEGDSSIKKIDADGNVRLLTGERIVTSRYATYFAEPEEHIIFIGEPRASEGENVVTGTKMIYFMADDRSIVENSRVILMERKGESSSAAKEKLR
jgi:lipopolysaccharide export system protein LptA